MDLSDNQRDPHGPQDRTGGSAHRLADLALLAQETDFYDKSASGRQAHRRRPGRRRLRY